MKISERGYHSLTYLNNKSIDNLLCFDCDRENIKSEKSINGLNTLWVNNCEIFKSEVNAISSTFENASMKAFDKLIDMYQDFIKKQSVHIKGTFLFQHETIMIDYKTNLNALNTEMCIFVFSKEGKFVSCSFKGKGEENVHTKITNCMPDAQRDIDGFNNYIFQKVILTYMLKKYADVETKIVEAGVKAREFGVKYENETKTNITFLDSKWFTNIVRSAAFSVSGHFRLQPCKDNSGNWTKKIIWINEFEKEGYTSKAKITK